MKVFFYALSIFLLMVGTILLPPLFIYLFDYHPEAIPLLIFISLFLVYLDFKWGKDWSDYN